MLSKYAVLFNPYCFFLNSNSVHNPATPLPPYVWAPTVMLVGGGDGMGKLEATAAALAKTLSPEHQVRQRRCRLTDTHQL